MEKTGFQFNPKTHRYTLDGVPLVGVTTVLGVLNKPALIQWAADESLKYLNDHCSVITRSIGDTGLFVTVEDIKQARTAHAKKRDAGADAGKDVHLYIETIIKSCIAENNGFIPPNPPPSLNEQVDFFIKWGIDNNVQFTASEKKMYSKKLGLAGTADFVCIIDGKKFVGDIKTFNRIYDMSPFLQTAGYRVMLEEMGETGFEGSIIIQVGKDGSFSEHVRLDTRGEDMKVFLSLLDVYKATNTFKLSL